MAVIPFKSPSNILFAGLQPQTPSEVNEGNARLQNAQSSHEIDSPDSNNNIAQHQDSMLSGYEDMPAEDGRDISPMQSAAENIGALISNAEGAELDDETA
jgi:hypothetical protein